MKLGISRASVFRLLKTAAGCAELIEATTSSGEQPVAVLNIAFSIDESQAQLLRPTLVKGAMRFPVERCSHWRAREELLK